MELKIINTGGYPNDGTGETLPEAFAKVNHNFNLISDKLNVKFELIVWNGIEDTKEAFDTINRNFDKVLN